MIVFAMLSVISSCQTSRTSRVSQTEMQLLQYSLKKGDLPNSGWSVEGEGWGADYGGESYGITYIRDEHVFVNHIVSMHSSDVRAKQAYQEWEGNVFDVTNLQPEVPYTPLDQNDDHRIECYKIEIDSPLMVCIYLQRHGTIISYVRISFDDKSKDNLTFAEVNDMLLILDKRLSEVVVR